MFPLDVAWAGDLSHVVRISATLLGLGIVMAISPTTFGIEIGTVQQATDARRRVLVIAGAVALSSTLLGLIFLVINPTALHALWTGRLQPIVEQHWVDALAGLVLVIIGSHQWRQAARRPRSTRDRGRLDRPAALFGFVAAESLVSTTGPATMYLVVHTISSLRPAAVWPVAYVVFLVGLVAPYVFLGIAITRIPAAARRLTQLAAALERRDLRRPVAALVIIAGALLVVVSVLSTIRSA